MPVFRRAVLADRPAMLEICADVWDGEDYLPQVFDEWVTAPGGQLTAAELDGRVVALGRVTRFAPGEYWLEGLRVHPGYRGRGLAAAMHNYHVDLWRRSGEGGTLRLATDSENHASLKLCERTGFAKIFEFTFAVAEAADASHRFTRVSASEASRAFDLIRHLPAYAEQHCLCDLGWKWRALTPAYLAGRIAAGAVYQWNAWEGVLVTIGKTDDDPHGHELLIQFPGVDAERRPAFLSEVRALAHALGQGRVRWSPMVRAEVLAELPSAGYRRWWESVECCFELRA
jgi:GNAT superfamily N-acetyltransferase